MLKQLSIYAENKKGALQTMTNALYEAGINIWGSVTNDGAEYGINRMVVSDPDKAKEVLTERGYLCRFVDVLWRSRPRRSASGSLPWPRCCP